MADTAGSGRRGFRSLFGKRSDGTGKGGSESPRKLSKKNMEAEPEPEKELGGSMGPNTARQDSGSFSSDENAWRSGNTVPAPVLRDDAERGDVFGGNLIDQRSIGHGTQSIHHEGYQHHQFTMPIHTNSNPRSTSEPQVQAGHLDLELYSSAPAKQPSAKLRKESRRSTQIENVLDKDTGERKDLTDMMHALTYNTKMDIEDDKPDNLSIIFDPTKPDGTAILGRASPEIWLLIADFLSPLDVANLSSTCRTLSARLGRHPYKLLVNPAHRHHRMDFLLDMDRKLPRHLFCFPCLQWHLRIQPGLEKLKPHNVLNPLFECPNYTNIHLPPPRIRITEGRMLPFAFLQLVRRSWAFGSDFGIQHQSLSRRWKEPYSKWMHETRYHITDKGHVLMRVKSQRFVHGGMQEAAKRMLLFSREDYTPYFSVCSHWKEGILTSIPKCALNHIPFTPVEETTAYAQLRERAMGRKANGIVNLCFTCRPMRRCLRCPTEYLFELKVLEDKSENSFSPDRFKQALLVTRWSDLGPARSPTDAEWAAVMGENEEYDSFKEIGIRAVSGVFESAFTDTIPGQRILSMNPKGEKADESGGNWY